jgi:signal transduction histidine kinase
MAEVATGVLHNVGNVLNSVNISAAMIAQKIRNSKSANLAKVADMLRQRNGDLAQFLTQDEKGRQLPGYLEGLSKYLDTEKEYILEELHSLASNIDHIKEIVTMQQANAKLAGVVELTPVAALVEDALKINQAAFQRHDVHLTRQFDEVPPITVDRHKVLQILVNLFNNAKYACDEGVKAEKLVNVQIKRAGENRVQIVVSDNGMGISPDNLTRIFAHGFTTRKNGHGFGLHSGALAAKELGGELTAHSEGRGEGAAFILELPIENEVAAELATQ